MGEEPYTDALRRTYSGKPLKEMYNSSQDLGSREPIRDILQGLSFHCALKISQVYLRTWALTDSLLSLRAMRRSVWWELEQGLI